MRLLHALVAMSLALFVGGAGIQGSWLNCRMEKQADRSCCCRHVRELPDDAVETFRRAPCCDSYTAMEAGVPPSSGAGVALVLHPPTLIEHAAPPVLARVPSYVSPVLAPDVLGPRTPTGPPLHIRHRSLLI